MSDLTPDKYFALREPCRDCPFRCDQDFPMPRDRREEIAEALGRGEQFVCHKTVDYSDDLSNQSYSAACAGARETARRSGVVSQLEQVSGRLGITVKKTDAESPVYGSLREWSDREM